MNRPPLEVADLIRVAGQQFIEASRRWITGQHLKVLPAIERCRTAALGGHRDRVPLRVSCHLFQLVPKSALPQVSGPRPRPLARGARTRLLPTRYVHVVFTLPRGSPRWPCRTRRSSTISCSTPVPKRCSKSPAIPAISAPRSASSACSIPGIRNWSIIPMSIVWLAAGGLSPDHPRWISSRHRFFLPVKVLSRVFRGKFVAGLKPPFTTANSTSTGISCLWRNREPSPPSSAHCSVRTGWSTASRPSAAPNTCSVISALHPSRGDLQHRLVSLADGHVTFRWRDSAHGNKQRLMTLAVEEFLRRFLLHVLPRGFRAHPPLRLSGPPAASRTSSALFAVASAIPSSSGCNCPAGGAPHSLAVAMSALRRNHASCRTPLRRATPPPISTSSQPVRRLNPHFQPRISLVLRRAHWFCVSHLSECSMVVTCSPLSAQN